MLAFTAKAEEKKVGEYGRLSLRRWKWSYLEIHMAGLIKVKEVVVFEPL